MKKLIAYWKRYWHCSEMSASVEGHNMLTYGKFYSLFGVIYRTKAQYIGCTCGKSYYSKIDTVDGDWRNCEI